MSPAISFDYKSLPSFLEASKSTATSTMLQNVVQLLYQALLMLILQSIPVKMPIQIKPAQQHAHN